MHPVNHMLTQTWLARDFALCFRNARVDRRMPNAVNMFEQATGELYTVKLNLPDATLPSVSLTVDMNVMQTLSCEDARARWILPLVDELIPDNERVNSRRNRLKAVLWPRLH